MSEVPVGHVHDPSEWINAFAPMRGNLRFHLYDQLRGAWPLLYWLLRVGGSTLEVGCGTGRTSIMTKLLDPSMRVAGVDVQEEVCAFAREYAAFAKADIEIKQGDALAIPYPDKSFRIVYSNGLLEHYADDWIVKALKEQCRVASELVIAMMPTEYHYYPRFRHYGDERLIPKVQWISLCYAAADIVEFSTIGNPTEEEWFLVLLRPRTV